MLLNSRSLMKGSLRDLIEVSVGQTRGSFIQPGILFSSHSQSWRREGGRRLFLWFLPSGQQTGGGVSEISSKMRVQSRVWAGRTCCNSIRELQRRGEEEEEICVGFERHEVVGQRRLTKWVGHPRGKSRPAPGSVISSSGCCDTTLGKPEFLGLHLLVHQMGNIVTTPGLLVCLKELLEDLQTPGT